MKELLKGNESILINLSNIKYELDSFIIFNNKYKFSDINDLTINEEDNKEIGNTVGMIGIRLILIALFMFFLSYTRTRFGALYGTFGVYIILLGLLITIAGGIILIFKEKYYIMKLKVFSDNNLILKIKVDNNIKNIKILLIILEKIIKSRNEN